MIACNHLRQLNKISFLAQRKPHYTYKVLLQTMFRPRKQRRVADRGVTGSALEDVLEQWMTKRGTRDLSALLQTVQD